MKIVLSKESIFLERTNITTRFLQKLLILIFQILFFIDFYCFVGSLPSASNCTPF